MVTRTLAQLAGDLRVGDGVADPTGPEAVVLARVAATARTVVLTYAPDAPDAIHNEAFVRLAGWLYDHDPSGRGTGNGLRTSGARALLAPYRVRRGVVVEGAVSDALRTTADNPVVDVVIDEDAGTLTVRFANGAHRTRPLPAGTATEVAGAAYNRVALIASIVARRDIQARNSARIFDPADIAVTLGDPRPLGVELHESDDSVYASIPTIPPDGINAVIIDIHDTADADAFATSAGAWLDTFGREIFYADDDPRVYCYASLFASSRTRNGLGIRAGNGTIPQGMTFKFYYARLGGTAPAPLPIPSLPDPSGGDAGDVVARNAAGDGYELVTPEAGEAGDLADGAVTTAKIADGAVTFAKIADGQVGTAKLAVDAVTHAKINDGAVVRGKIGPAAVDEAELADGAVALAKIADGAVGTAKIAGLAVTHNKLADAAVTPAKLAAAAVQLAALSAEVLARIAPALANNGGKLLAVNAAATALELIDAPEGGGGGLPAAANAFSNAKLVDNSAIPSLVSAVPQLTYRFVSFISGPRYVDPLSRPAGKRWLQLILNGALSPLIDFDALPEAAYAGNLTTTSGYWLRSYLGTSQDKQDLFFSLAKDSEGRLLMGVRGIAAGDLTGISASNYALAGHWY